MKNIKTLIREVRSLAKFVEKEMPLAVSRRWLWTAQNAFLTETDPSNGRKWSDRYGLAYGKGLKHIGNIEPYLTYKKLHRTGRLLRGLKVKKKSNGGKATIELYNNVRYAEDHELGANTKSHTIKKPYVRGGASSVVTGGNVVARPHMKPSLTVRRMPYKLTEEKIKKLGW